MTTPRGSTHSPARVLGRLVVACDVQAGQYIHIRPLRRSGLDWCLVRSNSRLRRYQRLELETPDGTSFWCKLTPGYTLRCAEQPLPVSPPAATVARELLRKLYPRTDFRGRPSNGETSVMWDDGPNMAVVSAALANAGLAHLRCGRTTSSRGLAAVTVRQALEGSLADDARFFGLCNSLDQLTDVDWTLGRQLSAFTNGTQDLRLLTATVRQVGVDILADTAGIPVPPPLQRCNRCWGTPDFTVRALGARPAWLSCPRCLDRYAHGGW